MAWKSIEMFPQVKIYRASQPLPRIFQFKAPDNAFPLSDKQKAFVRKMVPFIDDWLKTRGLSFDKQIRCTACGFSCRFEECLFDLSLIKQSIFTHCPRCKLFCP